ncbi:MAG: ParB/RepB/Spo0J family partition protein [Ignavibacteriae bacterium]|nr:ParB/RepB/Spo0J family partition protein [Ignavibacteriota bacterium]
MSKVKPVLGRGLASLIPRALPSSTPIARQDDGLTNEIIANVDIDKIKPNPYQPRLEFDPVTLDELKRSIQEKGIIQPITVCRVTDGYQLISGERRVRAAREAGLRQVPAYIIRVRTQEEMLELALIENLQREHLNPIEIAISYKRLIDECKYTQEQVSERIGKDRTTIANTLRLLKLPEPIRMAVRKGEVSAGHARALVAIDNADLQMSIFHRIVNKGLSVRDVERLVREEGKRKPRRVQVPAHPSGSSLAGVEEKLRQTLGTKVEVKTLTDGKGQILIEYYSLDDLDRLLELFALIQDQSS